MRDRRTYVFSHLMAQTPMLLPALGIVTGICGGALFPQLATTEGWNLLALFLVMAVAWLVAYWASRNSLRDVAPFAFFLGMSVASVGLGVFRYAIVTDKEPPAWGEGVQIVKCCVLTPPRQTARTWLFDASVESGKNAGSKLRVRVVKQEGGKMPAPGDVLLLHGAIDVPRNNGLPAMPDLAAQMRRQDIHGTMFCYANHWKATGHQSHTLQTWALCMRGQLVDKYRAYFGGRDLAVLSALSLGDKTMLNNDVRAVFSETGTSHILALSGLHLGIIFSFFNLLLFNRFRRHRRTHLCLVLLGMVLLWFYVLLAGFPISLLRAAIMYTMFQVAAFFKRMGFSLNSLSVAACLLLLCDPRSLFDVGFQLSFLSVAGILLFQPFFPELPFFGRRWWQEWAHKILSSFYGLLTVSFCATVTTLPLVAFTFHRIPVYGILASFVAIPLAYLLLMGTILFLCFPFARAFLATIIVACLHLMFAGLEWVASLPCSSIVCYPTPLGIGLLYMLLLMAYSFLVRSSLRKLLYMFVVAIAVMMVEVYDYRQHCLVPQLVFYQNFSAPSIHCIESPGESYLWSTNPEKADSALAFAKRTFWERERLAQPVFLRGDTAIRQLLLTPHVLQFHRCRVGMLRNRQMDWPADPLPVDFLYLQKGWNRPLEEALRCFRPDTIILDATFSDFYRQRYLQEAVSYHVPIHDLQRDGALVVFVK